MDSADSFKSATLDGFEKQEETKAQDSFQFFESVITNDDDEEQYHRDTRKRIIIISISSIILVMLIIGAIIGVFVPMHKKEHFSIPANLNDTVQQICNSTLYPGSCYSSISALKTTSKNPSPGEIFSLSLQVTLNELTKLQSSIPEKLIRLQENEFVARNALDICERLIQGAVYHVNISVSSWELSKNDMFSTFMVSDIRTWLSTAITNQETCLDGLVEFKTIPVALHDEMRLKLRNSTEYTSNSLAIISNMFHRFQDPVQKRLLQERVLEKAVLVPNLTVSADGSGDFRRISDAVNAMPKTSKKRFFIYVKAGEYNEKVVVGPDYWNLLIYGDGMKRTIVVGNQSYGDGVSTFDSGTLIAEGKGFIAKDMGFKNTAGPQKLQAVAVRSSSDKSMFDRCYFEGYQDTLFVHSNRQYYRNCLIIGSIDFIFGNAAVVFHYCTIRPRQPEPGQYNAITAQGKSEPKQNTGISILQCNIKPFDDVSAPTFLGRPWKNYSTTVVMETNIEHIVDPQGWTPWEPNVDVPSTLFYAEHNNTGPGSITTNRVEWTGYRPDITEAEAEKFSVESFIQGSQWLIP